MDHFNVFAIICFFDGDFLDYYNNYKPQRGLDRLPPVHYREILMAKQKGVIPLGELHL